ncbi:uncharacterized protein LOC123334614 [Bubalus bubalis]|uniref:uncharacterized protein LOC123334614 n=1 Tax=Bubalus bubalis TaxID=89462 RepID=UPI001E1B902B|nr:uncharacterized protein LOC123334614 [Bubalus bubalis]
MVPSSTGWKGNQVSTLFQTFPFPSGPSRQRSLKKATCCSSLQAAVTAAAPRLLGSSVAASTPRAILLPRVYEHPPGSAESARPISPSLSFQVQLRYSVTVTAPGSWQAPPLPRQQHLLPRGTRLSRGTYLAKCAPGLSCIETFSSSCTRKGLPRKQLASSLTRRADGSINKAQASSSSPSPIPPCLPPPFHLPKARRRRAEQQQQVQKVMKGVSCLSLGLTFLRPRPLGLLSLHPSHPPAPAQKCHRGRASRWICWGGERSLVEQRKASRARLRWFGGGEEQGDRRLASACLGPGSRRASVGKKKRERSWEGE